MEGAEGEKQTVKLAIVGNSYVYFNSLPSQLRSLFESAGEALETSVVTKGGQSLQGHTKDPRVETLLGDVDTNITGKKFDYVMIQENSSIPGGAGGGERRQKGLAAVRDFFAPHVARLGAKPMLYCPPAHRNGSVYEAQRQEYPTFEIMSAKAEEGHRMYARTLGEAVGVGEDGVVVVPLGAAYAVIYDEEMAAGRDPQDKGSLFSQLYQPDDFHPSKPGTYLAACLTYAAMTGRTAVGLTWRPLDFDEADAKAKRRFGEDWKPVCVTLEMAERIQRVATQVVLGNSALVGATPVGGEDARL